MTTPDPVPTLFSLAARRLHTETPWKVFNEARRLALLQLARFYFAAVGVRWGKNWRLYGLPIVQRYRPSVLTLGDGAELRSTPRSNPLGPAHPVILTTRRARARLVIGVDFCMTGGKLCADESVYICGRVVGGAHMVIT